MNNKNIFSKVCFIAIALVAIFVVPANSSLIFGYGSSSSPSMPSAPSCNDSKPGSAPILLSAVASGPNAITLNWAKANDPVSFYLVTFGTRSGEQLYGNPNVGGSDTRSYTVNSLSGGRRYFFKVRAGNGCKPGEFSNEVSAVAMGGVVTGTPGGFAPGVLGAQTGTPVAGQTALITPNVTPGETPIVIPPQNNPIENVRPMGFFERIWNFFRGIFGN